MEHINKMHWKKQKVQSHFTCITCPPSLAAECIKCYLHMRKGRKVNIWFDNEPQHPAWLRVLCHLTSPCGFQLQDVPYTSRLQDHPRGRLSQMDPPESLKDRLSAIVPVPDWSLWPQIPDQHQSSNDPDQPYISRLKVNSKLAFCKNPCSMPPTVPHCIEFLGPFQETLSIGLPR
jgi:hypothetical protein